MIVPKIENSNFLNININIFQFFSVVTKSLMASMLNVQHQVKQLLNVVRRKDAEIEQYKLAGAELLRSNNTFTSTQNVYVLQRAG